MDRNILHDFFGGKCSEEDKKAIRVWLESDSKNMDILLKERKIFDQLILSQTEHTPEMSNTPKKPFNSKRIQWAAALLLFGLSALLLYTWVNRGSTETQWATIKAPYGNRVQVWLPDSTLVWINAGSTLRYPHVFSTHKRQVVLEGEAYFEVTPHKRKFSVQTAYGDVEVLGTKFNIEAPTDKKEFRVALMEGKVKVVGNDHKLPAVVLKAGELVELQSGKLQVSSIVDYSIYDWRNGIISFNNLSMDSLSILVKKYYDINLNVQNKNLKAHRYSGKFRTTDGIDQLLRILRRYEHFNVERIENSTNIYLM